MAIGGGKKERRTRDKTATRRGLTGIGKGGGSKDTKTGVGGIGTRKVRKISSERRILAASARGRMRENENRKRGQSKQQANETDRNRNLKATLPKSKVKSGKTAKTRKVGKVASKVAARTGKSKQASRAAARRIIKKRGK